MTTQIEQEEKDLKKIVWKREQVQRAFKTKHRRLFIKQNKLDRMSKVGLITFVTKTKEKLDEGIAELQTKLNTEIEKNVSFGSLLGTLVHPQVNYEVANMILDGIDIEKHMTNQSAIIVCAFCNGENILNRIGDKQYWLEYDKGRQCSTCEELLTNKCKVLTIPEYKEYRKEQRKSKKE